MKSIISLILAASSFIFSGCGSGLAQQCTQNPDGSCLGQWYPVAYNAGDFTGSGAMNWIVPQSGVQTYKYSIAGKAMIVSFYITGSNISGVLSNNLYLKIPAGKTATSTMVNSISLDNGGVHIPGFAYVVAGDTIIKITRIDEAVFNTDHWTYVYGQITFEIN